MNSRSYFNVSQEKRKKKRFGSTRGKKNGKSCVRLPPILPLYPVAGTGNMTTKKKQGGGEDRTRKGKRKLSPPHQLLCRKEEICWRRKEEGTREEKKKKKKETGTRRFVCMLLHPGLWPPGDRVSGGRGEERGEC